MCNVGKFERIFRDCLAHGITSGGNGDESNADRGCKRALSTGKWCCMKMDGGELQGDV